MASIVEYRLTDHAQQEMKRRNITETEISQVLSTAVYQSLMTDQSQRAMRISRALFWITTTQVI